MIVERPFEWWAKRAETEPVELGSITVGKGPAPRRQPLILTEPKAKLSSYAEDALTSVMETAIEAGHLTLPEGTTIADLVANAEWVPTGSVSLCRVGDIQVVRVEDRGLGYSTEWRD